MHKLFSAASAALALIVATPAAAAPTFFINSSGILQSVANLSVGGTLYNVTFDSRSCATVFSGCDAVSDFDFTTQAQANLAAQTLLTQVYGTNQLWDQYSNYTNTCADMYECNILIPYALGSISGTFNAAYVYNTSESLGLSGDQSGIRVGNSVTNVLGTSYTFARFVPVNAVPAAVPEPATWAMMLLGFGSIGFAVRKQHNRLLQTA